MLTPQITVAIMYATGQPEENQPTAPGRVVVTKVGMGEPLSDNSVSSRQGEVV